MRQALIAIATALCLLISPASYAGQGMGPGPGMTHYEEYSTFASGLNGWVDQYPGTWPWGYGVSYGGYPTTAHVYLSGAETTLTKTVTGTTPGNITFVAAKTLLGGLSFQVDAGDMTYVSSDTMQTYTVPLTTGGTHLLTFRASADGMSNAHFYITNVRVPTN